MSTTVDVWAYGWVEIEPKPDGSAYLRLNFTEGDVAGQPGKPEMFLDPEEVIELRDALNALIVANRMVNGE